MTDQSFSVLQVILGLLPLVISAYAIIALVVAARGVVKARREAYEIMHEDFVDLKRKVREELKKDQSDE